MDGELMALAREATTGGWPGSEDVAEVRIHCDDRGLCVGVDGHGLSGLIEVRIEPGEDLAGALRRLLETRESEAADEYSPGGYITLP